MKLERQAGTFTWDLKMNVPGTPSIGVTFHLIISKVRTAQRNSTSSLHV